MLQLLADAGDVGATRTTGGRYFGFVTGGVEPIALAASTLAGAWDQNAGLPVMSPLAAKLDEIAARWIVELLELPPESVASFCAGATVANLTGIITGRDALLERVGWDVRERGLAGSPPITVVDRRRDPRLGVEGASARRVRQRRRSCECQPTNAGGSRADAWPDTTGPTLVVLQAGNVNTGHSDPFDAIIPNLDRERTWVHVDGAFGLWAQARAATAAHTISGVEAADSWATDAHKWLNAPYDCGGRDLPRRRGTVAGDDRRAPPTSRATDERVPMNLGIQMSQAARAIPVWAILATLGRDGLGDLVERTCRLAERMARRLGRQRRSRSSPPSSSTRSWRHSATTRPPTP